VYVFNIFQLRRKRFRLNLDALKVYAQGGEAASVGCCETDNHNLRADCAAQRIGLNALLSADILAAGDLVIKGVRGMMRALSGVPRTSHKWMFRAPPVAT